LIPGGKGVDDGTVAIAMALLLFLLPCGRRGGERGRILGAEVFPKLPWGIVLLFGGGFALAQGFQTSGLSNWIGAHFAGLESAPDWVLVGAISTLITFLTELTSNIATTEMILPVLASIATAAKIHPLMLMIPAAISASCAFMMPVATPPNAIVFASGRIRIIDMVWAGLLLNLIAVVVVTVVFLLIGPSVFGIDSSALPTWVK
jgi:sodium-dependent dicarboxylate transporter 2/3/5